MKLLAALLAASALDDRRLREQVRYEDILAAPSENWLTFMGDYASNRHSPLDQITAENVRKLAPEVVLPRRWRARLRRSSPIVYDGVMYVTNSNAVYAIDARDRKIWQYRRRRQRPRQNRGVAMLGDRVFISTSDCRLVALNRFNGALIWENEFANYEKDGYSTSIAPLAVKGQDPRRHRRRRQRPARLRRRHQRPSRQGELALLDRARRGRAGLRNLGRYLLEWGGGATWLSGTYDPKLELALLGHRQPLARLLRRRRKGDNLYTDSAVALDPDTGKMKWHFQFTPHDSRTGTPRAPRC